MLPAIVAALLVGLPLTAPALESPPAQACHAWVSLGDLGEGPRFCVTASLRAVDHGCSPAGRGQNCTFQFEWNLTAGFAAGPLSLAWNETYAGNHGTCYSVFHCSVTNNTGLLNVWVAHGRSVTVTDTIRARGAHLLGNETVEVSASITFRA